MDLPRSRTLAIVVGGLVPLAMTGVAVTHPGGIVDGYDAAREDGSLRELTARRYETSAACAVRGVRWGTWFSAARLLCSS